MAIVGESGSGKSVFTKTFAGMLDANGYISEGTIIFNDEELADTSVALTSQAKSMIEADQAKLNEYSKLELGADLYRAMVRLEGEEKAKSRLGGGEEEGVRKRINELNFKKTELFNQKQAIDSKKEKERYKAVSAEIDRMAAEIKDLEKRRTAAVAEHKKQAQNYTADPTPSEM